MEADQLLAVVPVNEKEISRLAPGMTAEVVIEALGDGSVPGIVDSISPLIDPQSGNATIKVRFDNPGGKARPGMFARIRLTASEATQKMLVPRSCLVLREENRAVVLTVSNNRVFRREVVPGDDHRDRTEILSGLREGEVLVMDPAPLLHEGDEVVIDETE
jgi:RND family efflux transporter MFP subunit